MSHSETEVPCLACGKVLQQALSEKSPMQPDEGIYCETPGSYGSTVWDSLDGEYLVFLICDECMIRAGEQGRVMTYRKWRPVLSDAGFSVPSVVGREWLRNRGLVRWHHGLPADDEPLYLAPDELENIPVARPARGVELFHPVKSS